MLLCGGECEVWAIGCGLLYQVDANITEGTCLSWQAGIVLQELEPGQTQTFLLIYFFSIIQK